MAGKTGTIVAAILFHGSGVYSLTRTGFYYISKEFGGLSDMSEDSEIPAKRARREMYCLIHCSDDDGALVSPNSVESWRTLRRAAELRHHEDILGTQVNSPDEIPKVYYHRKCRSIFTMKRDLEKIISDEKKECKKDTEMTTDGDSQRRASIRGQPSTSRVYEKICMFCEKKDKYKKGSKTRESLTQARQLRTDISVKNAAELKMDSRVLALLSRELTAAEAHYHRSCYRQYTKVSSTSAEVSKQNENTIDGPYDNAEAATLVKLFSYTRSDIFVNQSIIELSKLNERL